MHIFSLCCSYHRFSEPTHNFFPHPSNQEVSPWNQTVLHNVSNVCSTTRNCKISYCAPRASERRSMQTAAILFTWSCVVVDGIMKGIPAHDTSLKWLIVTISMQKCFTPSVVCPLEPLGNEIVTHDARSQMLQGRVFNLVQVI